MSTVVAAAAAGTGEDDGKHEFVLTSRPTASAASASVICSR